MTTDDETYYQYKCTRCGKSSCDKAIVAKKAQSDRFNWKTGRYEFTASIICKECVKGKDWFVGETKDNAVKFLEG